MNLYFRCQKKKLENYMFRLRYVARYELNFVQSPFTVVHLNRIRRIGKRMLVSHSAAEITEKI